MWVGKFEVLKVRCPNCGLKASGDYCQWCHYPILRGRPTRGRKAKKQKAIEAKEAEVAARERAKQEATEARERAHREAMEAKEAEIAIRNSH